MNEWFTTLSSPVPSLEIWAIILRSLTFVVFYLFVGFGPGFLLGLSLANWVAGRREQLLMDKHRDNIRRASQHNQQWNPTHQRWQK
jgi:hypothetical protein